eukprot:3513679-Rhodomonas_salina.1
MMCLTDESEAVFTHGQIGAALQRVCDACNAFPLFQINGRGALSVPTIKKKREFSPPSFCAVCAH